MYCACNTQQIEALMNKTLYKLLCASGFLICLAILTPQKVKAQVMTTIAGSGSVGYWGDTGPATASALDSPGCVAIDGYGNIYISDQLNNCVRKVNAAGIITTIAGTGAPGYNGDTMAATAAQLNSNWGIAADHYGNVYVADQNNNRIRKVDTLGMITTIAGTGVAGFSGDNGPALNARISHPIGIAVDKRGNVYIGDADNYRVRRVDTAGIITTIAGVGSGGYSGDGGAATAAHIEFMWGLATDAAGYVYICDGTNNRVRRADPAPGGLITTVAGNGYIGADGDGGAATAAKMNLPTGVFVNSAGEIFIADCGNNRVRRVTAGGVINTVAGTGTPGFAGDYGPATDALLHRPLTICADTNNNLYIADLDNVRIREINVAPRLFFFEGHDQNINLCENAAAYSLDSVMAVVDYTAGLTDVWHLLSAPAHGELVISDSIVSPGGILVPSGLSYTLEPGYAGNDVFIVSVSDGTKSDTTIVNIIVTPVIASAGTITGQSQLCNGYAIALTDAIAGGTWSSRDTNVRIAATGDTVVVTGMATGVDTVLYIVSNGCNADTASQVLSVLPRPDAGTINGRISVCVGATIILTDPAPGGTWSSDNNTATVTAGEVTGEHPGPALIVYTVQNAACISTATYIVHVDSMPTPPPISGPASICAGTETALDGGSGLGTWSCDSTGIATVNTQTGQVKGLAAGTAAISYIVSNVCGAAGSVKILTVNPLPDAPVITRKGDVLYAPANYSAYQWTKDGIAIIWAVADTCKATTSGYYGVVVTSLLGCSNNSPAYAYPGCDADDLQIYPNPVQASLYVDWCDAIKIRITTADGKIVLTVDDAKSLDLSGLADGVYMISVYDRNGKIVKTKPITKVTN